MHKTLAWTVLTKIEITLSIRALDRKFKVKAYISNLLLEVVQPIIFLYSKIHTAIMPF